MTYVTLFVVSLAMMVGAGLTWHYAARAIRGLRRKHTPDAAFQAIREGRDDGPTNLLVASNAKDRKVILYFHGRVSWLGFDGATARSIAGALLKHADIADGKVTP